MSFSATPLALLVSVHATFLFFPHFPPFFFSFYRAEVENVFSTPSTCFSKEIILQSKGCSLGATALCFAFIFFILLTSKLFLSLSLPRISLKHLSSASHWLFNASLSFCQAPVGLLILFPLLVSCSCIPAYLHLLCCWKWGSGKIGSSTCSILTCWRRYLSLSQWSEKK